MVTVHASKHLITDILKNELGFSGVVTDWKILSPLHKTKVAENNRAAVKMSVMAGIDMSKEFKDYSFWHY
jgi:beta-glucosidase